MYIHYSLLWNILKVIDQMVFILRIKDRKNAMLCHIRLYNNTFSWGIKKYYKTRVSGNTAYNSLRTCRNKFQNPKFSQLNYLFNKNSTRKVKSNNKLKGKRRKFAVYTKIAQKLSTGQIFKVWHPRRFFLFFKSPFS
jgi:hypothetical protein